MRPQSSAPDLGTGDPDLDVVRLVDRHSADLLQLAGFFAVDFAVAQRMVVRAWLVGWPALLHRDGPDEHDHRTSLVRALAVGDPDDAEVAAGARALRLALRGAGCYVPSQAQADDCPGGPQGLTARVRALPGPLRLVLLLSDVQGWPAADVEALLEVRPASRRLLLALARDELCRDARHVTAV